MPLHAYYRVTPHGNGKPRPPWFSRRRALLSFLAAAQRVRAEVVVVADGGVPAELGDLVPGRVVQVRGGSAARSFRRLLDVADGPEVAEGLVWFAEDDYVYRPDALEQFCAAAQAVPEAGLPGRVHPGQQRLARRRPSQPARRGPDRTWTVAGRPWRRAWDSTSTFGVRAEVLRDDARLLRAVQPGRRAVGPRLVLAVQGVAPYPVRALHTDLLLRRYRATAGGSQPAAARAAVTSRPAPGAHRVAPGDDLATQPSPGRVPGGDRAGLADALE